MRKKRFYGVLVITGCILLQTAVVGILNNTNTLFVSPVCEAMGFSVGTFSACKSISGIVNAVLLPVASRLLERGKFRRVILSASLGLAVAVYAKRFCTQLWHFYLLSVVEGIGCSCLLTLPVPIVINNWFHHNTSTVLSMVLCSSGVVPMVASPIVATIIENCSWKAGYSLVGGTILLLGALASLLIRKCPEDVGMTPFGEAVSEAADRVETPRMAVKMNGRTLCFCICTASFYGIVSIANHVSSFATSIGFLPTAAALFNSFLMMGNLGSKLILGRISDHTSAKTSWYAGMGAVTFGLVLFALQGWLLYLGAVGCGCIYALCSVSLAGLVRQLFPMYVFGEAYALFVMVGSLSSSVMTSLMGTVFDITGSYRSVMLIYLGMILMSIASLNAACRLPQTRAQSVGIEG